MFKYRLTKRKRLPVFKGFCKDCDNIADWEPYTYCSNWGEHTEPNGWCYKWEKKRVEVRF